MAIIIWHANAFNLIATILQPHRSGEIREPLLPARESGRYRHAPPSIRVVMAATWLRYTPPQHIMHAAGSGAAASRFIRQQRAAFAGRDVAGRIWHVVTIFAIERLLFSRRTRA